MDFVVVLVILTMTLTNGQQANQANHVMKDFLVKLYGKLRQTKIQAEEGEIFKKAFKYEIITKTSDGNFFISSTHTEVSSIEDYENVNECVQ
jgi:hypothetical protein